MSDTARGWTPIQPANTAPPAGAYSPGVRAGNLLFISGQVPRDPNTGALAGDDIESQVRQVMLNLTRVLEAAGLTRAHLVSVTVYLTDVDDWGAFDRVYREFMEPPFPTRAVVGSELRGIRVEIAAVAMASA